MAPGEVSPRTRHKVLLDIYTCFSFVFYDPFFRNPFLPPFVITPLYRLMGARIGQGTYVVGCILDPHFVSLGAHTILGMDCVMIPHSREKGGLSYQSIEIGSGVTIGARALIFGGTRIADGAVVASGAVVPKNTKIGPKEIWGGIPAKPIGRVES